MLWLTVAPILFPLFLNLESLSGSIVPESFELATEKRAKARQEFEKRLAELETKKERLQEEARQQEAEREKEELARLREELVNEQAIPGQGLEHKLTVLINLSVMGMQHQRAVLSLLL